MTSVNFYCRVCGEVAGALSVVPSGLGAASVTISGLMCQESTAVSGETLRLLESVLASARARDLYDIDRLWASFYCPQCDASYCQKHWIVSLQFDDDFPGWYDCAYGVCPAGHRRMVDD
jgi:hypothetical protein